ncbi:MAG: LysR family transcriptional regulator [Nevskia sp.]
MTMKMNWDDLRYVLAIAREGSLGAAAKALDVNHSSVYRRLAGFEKTLDTRLFERGRNGYRLTPQGEALADTARRIEAEALAVELQLIGTDLKLSGSIRVSTGEALGMFLLPPLLRSFSELYPDVQIELSLDNRMADLSRRDADVVVRATGNPPEQLVGRRVGTIAFCSYASRAYLDQMGRDRPLQQHPWLGFDERLASLAPARWLRAQAPDARHRFRFDSLAAMLEATRAGLGPAVLPCFMADARSDLERLGEPQSDADFGIWMLTHPDLRRSARIRAFTRDIGDRIVAAQARLAGTMPDSHPP